MATIKFTARVAAKLGAKVVTGFTGSKIWKYVAMYPPVSSEVIADGYEDFARRWGPIIDVFDEVGVKFALEVHPSEIAYDYWTTRAALDAIGNREGFGINWDPSHMIWQRQRPRAGRPSRRHRHRRLSRNSIPKCPHGLRPQAYMHSRRSRRNRPGAMRHP